MSNFFEDLPRGSWFDKAVARFHLLLEEANSRAVVFRRDARTLAVVPLTPCALVLAIFNALEPYLTVLAIFGGLLAGVRLSLVKR